MSRTYRRRRERHDYAWVLRDYRWVGAALIPFLIDPHSKDGRRAIARFHSDACWTAAQYRAALVLPHLRSSPAHAEPEAARRWLDDPGHDPVFDARNRHRANWAWW